jgi:two-component system NtrC family sensor kinase
VIEISVLSSEFTRFYSRIVSSPGLQYAMIRDDGVILARYPVLTVPGLRLDANSGFSRTVAASPLGGYYTARSEVDDVERRFGIRRLPGYPIYMSAGIDTSEMRSDLIDGMGVHLIYGVPATLVLFGALANVLVRTRRLYAEQDRREAAEDTLRQVQKMEAIGRLSGGIAHDFNNLLMIIIGNLEIVQRMVEAGNLVQARAQRSIGNAMLGAKRAAALTQRLLAFSRQQPLNPGPSTSIGSLPIFPTCSPARLARPLHWRWWAVPACGPSNWTTQRWRPRSSTWRSMPAMPCPMAAN